MSEITAADLLSKNFVKVTGNSLISGMFGAMKKANQTQAVVFGNAGEYLGVSSKLAVLRKHLDFSRAKVENIVERKPVVSETATLSEIALQMIGADAKLLPVGNSKKVLGVVFALDVVKHLKSISELRTVQAKEIASAKPVVLPLASTFGQLINSMQENHVTKIPIVDLKNQLKGIVSFADLVDSFLLETTVKRSRSPLGSAGKKAHDIGKTKSNPLELPISTAIVKEVKTVSPNERLPKIIDIMSGCCISDVVVVEKEKVVGIITLRDLLECFLRLKREKKNIQFVSLPELDEIDAQFLNNAVVESYDKIRKVVKDIVYFVVHFKFHEHEGLRRKATVHLRVSVPGRLFVSSSSGWVLLDTVHDALKTLEREVFESAKK